MAWSSYSAQAILNHTCRGDVVGTAYEQPSQLYVALHYQNPTASGLVTTEVSGGSYTRQLVNFSAPDVLGEIKNIVDVFFRSMPTLSPGLTHVSVWDSVVGGNMIWYESVGVHTVESGDNVRFDVGNLTIKLPIAPS